jgi:uncharacterized SAM-binding protein YcdF (DUF218 family)
VKGSVLSGRVALAILVVVVLVAGGATISSIRLFSSPRTDGATHADAVIVLAGGGAARINRAEELLRAGVANTLVVSNGNRPTWPDGYRLCTEPQAFSVVCPTPRPVNTRGEARTISKLAAGRGWRRLVVVTAGFHVTRARLLFSRCYSGHLELVAAPGRLTRQVLAHEWLGTLYAETLARSC